MTFQEWAKSYGACDDGLAYLEGKRATWATWIQSCGDWRGWACSRLGVTWCHSDESTCHSRQTATCGEPNCRTCAEYNRIANRETTIVRRRLNRPATYAALRRHWETIVLPALRKEGVQ